VTVPNGTPLNGARYTANQPIQNLQKITITKLRDKKKTKNKMNDEIFVRRYSPFSL
jgi:hypothetical protein